MSDQQEQQPSGADNAPEPASEKVVKENEVNELVKGASAGQVSKGDVEGAKPMPLESLDAGDVTAAASSIDMIGNVDLNVRIELGRSKLAVEDILKLQTGSVVPLDTLAGDYVNVLVNDRLVARGEVLILNDNFCVRIAEITSPEERLGQTR